MAKEILINDNLYNRIKILADKKNMDINDLLDYLVLNMYDVNEEVNNYEEFKNILIEDTGLFNFKGGQSSIYNRLKESGVNTLQDLFKKYSLRELKYGANKIGDNDYIHNEMNGIISLLRYQYLNIESTQLNDCLTTSIDAYYPISISDYPTGFPGEIFKTVMWRSYPGSKVYKDVSELFRLLKSCGFNLTCSKALIDYAYNKKVKEEKLGDFLLNINLNEIKQYFNKVSNDYTLFLNIYNIITKYYINICINNTNVK